MLGLFEVFHRFCPSRFYLRNFYALVEVKSSSWNLIFLNMFGCLSDYLNLCCILFLHICFLSLAFITFVWLISLVFACLYHNWWCCVLLCIFHVQNLIWVCLNCLLSLPFNLVKAFLSLGSSFYLCRTLASIESLCYSPSLSTLPSFLTFNFLIDCLIVFVSLDFFPRFDTYEVLFVLAWGLFFGYFSIAFPFMVFFGLIIL